MADMENNKRKSSLNSTSSTCDSPTTPDSSSTFFGAQTTYPYINSNQNYQDLTTDGYFDSWESTWEASSDLCKNSQSYFPSIMTTGITYAYDEGFSQTSLQPQEQTEVYYVPTPIPTPITAHNLQAWNSYS
jgi:hypothetical protein